MQRIVVGVDGSANARRAFQWAVEESRLRGAAVEAVHAWHWPYMSKYPFELEVKVFEDAGRQLLDDIVATIDDHDLPAPVEKILAGGRAASVLVETAKGADLLVVGSRGHGGFAGLLLGSVSQEVAHHTPCPLVIVPPED